MNSPEQNGIKKSPIIAAVLSLIFLGGGGQMYCGYFKRGLLPMVSSLILVFVFGLVSPLGYWSHRRFFLARELSKGESIDEFDLCWPKTNIRSRISCAEGSASICV